MTIDRGAVRYVSWRDLLPWLVIFRAARVALSPAVLLLAFVAAALTPIGWRVAELILPDERVAADPELASWVATNRGWTQPTTSAPRLDPALPGGAPHADTTLAEVRERGLALPLDAIDRFWSLAGPMRRLFMRPVGVREAAYLLAGSLWSLLIWSVFGGAITRIAAVRLGAEDRIGLVSAMRHAVRKFGSYFAAPLFPLAGVALLVGAIAICGLILRADFGAALIGLFWPLVLVGAFGMAVLLVGLLFGWPLMWATISAEGSDAFDALSRSFAYTFQRPFHYLAYALLAAIVGALAYFAVLGLTIAIEELAWWSAAWGAGEDRVAELRAAVNSAFQQGAGGMLGFGAAAMRIALGFLRLVTSAFGYGFFWCAAEAIYLLLRRDVDHTEFDEVWSEEDIVRRGLPALGIVAAAGADVGEKAFESDGDSAE